MKTSDCEADRADTVALARPTLQRLGKLPAGATDEIVLERWKEHRQAEEAADADRQANLAATAERLGLAALARTVKRLGGDPSQMGAAQMQAYIEESSRQIDAARRREAMDRRATNLWKKSGAPGRHAINSELQDNAKQRQIIDTLSGKIGGFLVVLLGPRGTGKTQIAVEVIRRVTARGDAARYIKALDLFRDLRSSFTAPGRGQAGTSEKDIIDRWKQIPLLVVDELHERAETPYENNALRNLLDCRYDGMRSTLLIANQTKDQFGENIGDTVISRIHETGTVLLCDWGSYRQPGNWLTAAGGVA